MLPTVKRCALAVLAALVLVSGVSAKTPYTVNYQGRLTDGSGLPVADGPHTVTFRIYDRPVAGTLLWTEPDLVVTTAKGLFTATLGSPTSFPAGSSAFYWLGPGFIFATNDELWLETEFAGTTLVPRHKLQSVPYAISAGSLHGRNQTYDPEVGIDVVPEDAVISTLGFDGEEKIRLWGPAWGEIFLFDAGPASGATATSEKTAVLSANFNSGGSLSLNDNAGNSSIIMKGGGTGDGSVVIPTDAINSTEILDEPGIASNQAIGGFSLLTTAAVDIITVTITTPAAGYIVVDGKFYGLTLGTTDAAIGYVQIDETAGGTPFFPYPTFFGATDFPSTGTRGYPGSVYRIFYKPTPGTYTFRLEGGLNSSLGSGAVVEVAYPMIKATYFPTSYGSVMASAPVAPTDNPDFQTEQVNDPILNLSTTVYTSDLRYYELQVKKAQAAALKAELDLAQAKLAAARQSQMQPNQSAEEK